MAYDNGNAKVFAELDLFSENLPKICKKKIRNRSERHNFENIKRG